MARVFKRDKNGKFAKGSGGGGKAKSGAKKKTLKQRYQKGESGAGAIHRRRAKQWKSGKKRDKAKVLYKSSGLGLTGGHIVHAASYANHKRVQAKKKKTKR